ncbi:MAG: hypothetical protein FWC68_06120 [Oscillospiraceae bacterium]|nr:hypothetical protein [Oscillospiraceae bacterium]
MKIKQITITLIFLVLIAIPKNSYSVVRLEGIENFPASYRPYLLELQRNFPEWRFTALYTGFDWEYVIDNQNVFGRNLVPISFSRRWKNTTPGQYNVEVDAGWVDASRQALEFTMDPRNFLHKERVLQFKSLSYEETASLEGIERILQGTEMHNRRVEFRNSSGQNIVTDRTYAELILNAGRISRVHPYHLASRIRQEVGHFLSHPSISGVFPGYEGLFNFYNIGATSDPDFNQVIRNGLRFARYGRPRSGKHNDSMEY